MGLFTFIPLYELSRGNSAAYGTRLLAVFLFAGALGTLIGGPLADRVGRRPVPAREFIVSPPLILVYALVGGAVRHRRALLRAPPSSGRSASPWS